jgi:hypothetical protein
MRFRVRKASHANKQVNDWLGGQARHRRAADMLACDTERTESSLKYRALLLEHYGPCGVKQTSSKSYSMTSSARPSSRSIISSRPQPSVAPQEEAKADMRKVQ